MSAVTVRPARAEDAAAIAAVLAEGAAYMRAMTTPGWTPDLYSQAYAAAGVARGVFLVAECDGAVVGCCALLDADPDFWPEDAPGAAAYLHKLSVRRAFAGQRASRPLVDACLALTAERGLPALRLDCHPNTARVYERLGFAWVDTIDVAVGEPELWTVSRFEIRLPARG